MKLQCNSYAIVNQKLCLFQRKNQLNELRISVRSEQSVLSIQLFDGLHVLIGKQEVKDIHVLFHAIFVS